jgi:hypothetical protein
MSSSDFLFMDYSSVCVFPTNDQSESRAYAYFWCAQDRQPCSGCFRTVAVLGAVAVIATPIRIGNQGHFEAIIELNDQEIVNSHRDECIGLVLHSHLLLYVLIMFCFIWLSEAKSGPHESFWSVAPIQATWLCTGFADEILGATGAIATVIRVLDGYCHLKAIIELNDQQIVLSHWNEFIRLPIHVLPSFLAFSTDAQSESRLTGAPDMLRASN